MAAFKTLNAQDILISPLEVNKGFYFEGATELTSSNISIDRYLGTNADFLVDQSLTGETTSEYQVAVYNSIKQLYYSNYLSSSNGETSTVSTASFNTDNTITGIVYSPLYYNYLSSDLDAKRYFPTSSGDTIGIMSIPKNMFGDYIQPYSLQITTDSGSYYDDGEGRLKRITEDGDIFIGNVIYEHGIVVLTGGSRQDGLGSDGGYGVDEYGNDVYGGRTFDSNDILNFVTSSNITCSFSSSYLLYETQYKCTIGESEFNFTQNPSISQNDGAIYNFATQDYFAPYVTTIGLYNDRQELLAVGKLAQPFPTSKTTDTTILINVDRQ